MKRLCKLFDSGKTVISGQGTLIFRWLRISAWNFGSISHLSDVLPCVVFDEYVLGVLSSGIEWLIGRIGWVHEVGRQTRKVSEQIHLVLYDTGSLIYVTGDRKSEWKRRSHWYTYDRHQLVKWKSTMTRTFWLQAPQEQAISILYFALLLRCTSAISNSTPMKWSLIWSTSSSDLN